MDLKDFVSQALCDIIDGVKNAQERTAIGGRLRKRKIKHVKPVAEVVAA